VPLCLCGESLKPQRQEILLIIIIIVETHLTKGLLAQVLP